MTKPLSAGREVDAWCAKCKRISGHKIVAMVGPVPARVECIACGAVHNFKPRPPGETASGPRASPDGTPRRTAAPTARASLTKAEQARKAREAEWEKATSGRLAADFRKYDTRQRFAEGELVRHAKFGDGVVVRVIDVAKIEVLFSGGDSRTLAQGMP